MSPSAVPSATERSGDPLWDVLVGTYVALLGTPVVLLAATRLGVRTPGLLYGTTVTALALITGLGWRAAARRPRLAVRLGSTPVRWLPGAAPVPYALGGFASLAATGVVGVLAFFFGLGALVLGFVLGVMARTRHTDARLDGVETDATFEAGWPAAARRRLGLAVGAVVVVAAVCFAVGFLADRWLLQSAGQILFPAALVLYSSTAQRHYTVSAAGLEQRLPVARRLWSWARFAGYTRTSDALVLHRPRRVDIRLALADLDDPDAVEDAIARYLRASEPRR